MAKRKHNDLRDAVIQYLTHKLGWFVWGNDTVGIWDAKRDVYRTNPKRLKGVSDIIGMTDIGRFVAIEIKVGKDRLSIEQKVFLQTVEENAGIAFVVKDTIDEIDSAIEATGHQF